MNILDRYIGQSVLVGVLAVLAILTAIYSLISFAGEISQVGRADYTLWNAVEYSLLWLPTQLYELFPLSMLLGTMLGLGWLANHNELVVIRTAGVSLLRIVYAVMKTAMLLMLLAVLIGEGFAPVMSQYADQQRVKELNAKVSLNTDYGLWARDGLTYIHISRVENDGRLIGITLYTFDQDNRLQKQIYADHAIFDGKHWQMQKVKEIQFTDYHFVSEYKKNMQWQTLLDQEMVHVVSVDPEHLPIWKLVSYINYLKSNELEYHKQELAFWIKVFSPLTILAMVLLAVPFVFGSMRQVSIGKQIFLGFLVGLAFYIGSRLIGQMGLVYGVPAIASALLPVVIVVAITLLAYRKIR